MKTKLLFTIALAFIGLSANAQALAGADQSICTSSTTMQGSVNTACESAQWSVASSPSGVTFTSPTNPTTTVTGIGCGVNVLVLSTVYIGYSCPSNKDTVVVTRYCPPSTANAGVDQTNCNNSTFTLAGNTPAVGTGSWSVISGTASITNSSSPTSTVTGITVGNSATLRWTICNGSCNTNTTADVVLTNNPLPNVTATGTTTICSGTTTNISASGATTYSWLPSGSLSNASISNPIVSPLSTTTYTVTGTANGCSNTAIVLITVNQTPTITLSSNSPLCPSSTLNLSANLISSASYNWTGVNSFFSNTQNPAIANTTVADSGKYYCTITSNAGCSKKDSILVSVSAIPHASITTGGSTSICTGDSVQLTATWGGAYLWNTGATTQSIEATTAGNYTCTVNNPNGCPNSATASTVSVSIKPSPSIPTIVQTGTTLASNTTGTSYKWYRNGTLQTQYTTQFITITSAENGNWWVEIINSQGCSSTSAWFASTVVTGISEVSTDFNITIYPNPTSGIINIQFGQFQNAEIKICDVYGITIYQNNITSSNIQIDLSTQANGIYFISVKTNEGIVNKKMVVSH